MALPDVEVETHDKSRSHSAHSARTTMIHVGVSVAVLLGSITGIRYFRYSTSHVSTDDAYLTADIVTIAPQVSGTVQHVYVKDNQLVKAGQLIAQLDDSSYKAAVQQAEANYEAAVAAADASGVNISITHDSSYAQMQQSEAGVNQSQNAIGMSKADVMRAEAAVGQSSATAMSMQANIATTKAAITAAYAQKKRADSAAAAALAMVETAEADVRSANAALVSADAIFDKAVSDNKRYQKLLADNVIGAQQAEQAAVGLQTARSQQQAAQEHVKSSLAASNSRKAEYQAAKEQLTVAQSGIEQAKAQYNASTSQYTASLAGVKQAQAQLQASSQAASLSQARHQQAQAVLAQTRTAPKQVRMSIAAANQAKARVNQAHAALVDAKLRLSYTRITAPVSGIISKRSVNEGVLVQTGTPLMAVVPPPSTNIWVLANFKETQLAHVTVGQQAQIHVDALPGVSYDAVVDSISSGTGASFALLPPDNATGNFTKVVQRIPVKLIIRSKQKQIDRLRNGMSVTAVITTR